MVKVRQDAWSHEDDLLLAETVLRHIREGSTQLHAFDEVGDHLNRTSAACGFRWNAEVRQRYDQAIDIAKRQRKEKKRAVAKQQSNNESVRVEVDSQPAIKPEVQVEETIAKPSTHVSYPETPTVTFDQVIRHMKDLKQQYHQSNQSKSKVQHLEMENDMLRKEKESMELKLSKMEKKYQSVQDDYQVLIQIMDRARKMVVFDEEDRNSSNAFRMDKNGNLEQVAR